ncbi:DUF4136 domain-containing protein [Thalassotalea fonticola]|uniref:DUF4136 domain-containing protein n=1 Tax=Thalassotalea fonticola TaxID=3065649 RepID=A0ABZ0GRN4_9GAMM|nr:DUF4136 domain-containing protein [Colwelliaceae bacterium S1-1]
MKFSCFKFAALLLLLSGCATSYNPDIDYNPEYNFAQLQTFVVLDDFEANQQASKKLNRNLSSLDNDRLIKAISNTLKQKGMAEVDKADADMQVRFQLVTKDKTQLRTYNTGFYQCWRCRGFYSYPHHTGTQVEIKDYVEGTIIIDFVDPAEGKSVWRSVVSKAIKKTKIPVEEKQAKIQELVNAMLASFKAPIVAQ